MTPVPPSGRSFGDAERQDVLDLFAALANPPPPLRSPLPSLAPVALDHATHGFSPLAQTGLASPGERRRTEPMAMASFILSLAGFLFIPVVFLLPITSVIAIVLGGAAIDRIDHSGGSARGRHLAMTGRIIGIVTLLIGLASTLIFIVFIKALETIN